MQIAYAVRYLHSMDVLHRDIKPENILITTNTATGALIVKLLDFGLSKYSGMGSAAKSFVGTPCYVAPEVEAASRSSGRTYGQPVDCWSMGSVLYVMLVARFPEFQYINGVKTLVLPPALWKDASDDAKHLVKGLIHGDPNARLSANAVLRHPWLRTLSEASGIVSFGAVEPRLPEIPPASAGGDHGEESVCARQGRDPPREEVMALVRNPECATRMRTALEATRNGQEMTDKHKLHLSSLLMLQR